MRIWLQITCGRGPRECAYAVPRVLRVMLEEAAAGGLSADVLESEAGRYDGTLYSALVAVEGATAKAFCKRWKGPVCWIYRSPFRPNHKRKNWFLSVESFLPPNPASAAWKESELRYDTMRASGPGGQHVNKTESAVRVTHGPTGLSATAREERSQVANRKLALARLAEMFRAKDAKAMAAFDKTRWGQHNDLERGNAVRTFVGEGFEER